MGGVATRILTVEDDERIRTAVKLALEDEGWNVAEADTGEVALEQFQREPTDVVLIDIMLPGIDGFEVCRSIRRISDVPIVMVTARADTHDVVAGLEAGADDYLTKPFSLAELLARVRALLRRAGRLSSPTWQVGDLTVDEGARVVHRGDAEVELTRTEFDLLAELGRRRGRATSKEQLLAAVWQFDSYDPNLVEVHISALRRKLEDHGDRLIHTVRGVGYVLRT